jgi:hypothetical protein
MERGRVLAYHQFKGGNWARINSTATARKKAAAP